MFSKQFLNFMRDLLRIGSRAKAKVFLIFIIYFLLINIVSYIVMTLDKKRAKKEKKRIPENVLFTLAILGGGLGAIISMKRHVHKTKKKSFTIGMPITATLNILTLIGEIIAVYLY